MNFSAYTVTALHANFLLSLFPSTAKKTGSESCSQCLSLCLRRFFRRFSVCLILCIWSLSFTGTIPLLYSIDSNEKVPKPVYCPGTKEISYLEEWFDRNRLIQTILFNLIPSLTSLVLSLIVVLKYFFDIFVTIFRRAKRSKFFGCQKKSRSTKSSLIEMNSYLKSTIDESMTASSDITDDSVQISGPTFGQYCSNSFLRFLLIVSSSLIACIYPVAMRFYLIYFSVFVPLIFTVLNSSPNSAFANRKLLFLDEESRISALKPSTRISSIELTNFNRYQPVETKINSNQENRSALLTTNDEPRPTNNEPNKLVYFSNNLYENTRNIFRR